MQCPLWFRRFHSSQTNPETGTTSYGYNTDGTLNTRTDAKGLITTYAYDSYQRVTQVTHKPSGSSIDPNQTVTFVYDQGANGYGRLSSASGGVCPQYNTLATYTDTYTYTVAGEVATKTLALCGGITMSGSFAYDSEGKLSTVSYPQGTAPSDGPAPVLTYSYDAMSRMTGASTPASTNSGGGCTWSGTASWASGATYNPAGQLTALQQLGSISANCSHGTPTVTPTYLTKGWSYNPSNQLTEIDTTPITSPASPTSSLTYSYSPTQNNGQITEATDFRTGDTLSYTYDLLKRLTKTISARPAWQQTFQYDGFGNLTSKSVPSGSGEPAFPGVNSATNRLSGATYDANGNVIAINGFALGYDGENRMVSSATGSGTDTNVYDEQGHRVWQSRSANANYGYFYAPDGKLLSVFYLQTSNPQATSIVYHEIYFGGLLLGTTQAYVGGELSTLTDRLGSKNQTYAYGTDVPSQTPPATSSPVDFETYLNDSSTGFEYANQRWYVAGYGRFLSADHYNGSINTSSPQSFNRFSYVLGDPTNRFDPSGLDPSGPDPNTPPFGCDLFGGCVPGCPIGGVGSAFLPDGTEPFCFTPAPVPIIPISGPSSSSPDCFAQLKFRPVDDPIAKLVDAVHSFWWVEYAINGIETTDIITAGPNPGTGPVRYLEEFVVPGNAAGANTSLDSTEWKTPDSSTVCYAVSRMLEKARTFPPHSIPYDPVFGPNSNSAARLIGEAGGFNMNLGINWSGIAVGWNVSIVPFSASRWGGAGQRVPVPTLP